jgi:hypothetical protein
MRTAGWMALTTILGIGTGVLSAEETKTPDPGFTSLFDGKTLTGWRPHLTVPAPHVGGKWMARDGVLIGDQDEREGGGFLITDGQYQNFILRFDLAQDYPTDTGVFVRMGDDGKSHQITFDNRPEGQIGSIYLPWTQKRVFDNPEGAKAFQQGAWNQVEIRVEGDPARIRLWLNGGLVTDFQHTAATTKGVPTKGYIGLQVHPKTPGIVHWKPGNTIRYRNLRIQPLNPG